MAAHRKVLLVSNDLFFLDTLTKLLIEFEGFLITSLSVNNFINKECSEIKVDLIILDCFMMKSFENDFYKRLSDFQIKPPIVYIQNESIDNNQLISAGFSYIIRCNRPIYFPKLLRDVLRLLNDFNFLESKVVMIGPYSFNSTLKNLTADGNISIRLTEMETKILDFLYKNKSIVVDKETLLTEVWGYKSQVMTHTLETHIYRLRKKMAIYLDGSKLLIGESGGYRLQL